MKVNYMKKESTNSSFYLYLRLLRYVKKFWLAFVVATFANILYSGMNAGFAYLLKPIINKGFVERDVHFIEILPFLVLIVFFLRAISNLVSSYSMSFVSRGVVMKLRQEIFSHLLKLPSSFYDHTTSGKILSTLIYNVEQVANAGSQTLTTLVQAFCLMIGLLLVMFSISWRLSLLYLVIAPVVAVVVYFGSKRIRFITLSLQKKMGSVTSIAEEAIEAYKIIRIFGGQEYETEKFNKATKKNRRRELKIVITKALTVSTVQIFAAIALSITIYLSTSNNSTLLNAGSFAALITAMWTLLKPLKDFTKVNTKIQRGLAGAETVFDLLDIDIEENKGKVSCARVNGVVCFDHVYFNYKNTKKNILYDINFSVKSGQVVALVGHSGGGKTTIVNLLQRFYEITNGRITIDGKDIKDVVLKDLRRQFAIVSQQVTLFNDTVAKNIAYGQQGIDKSKIINVAKAANCFDFIEQLSDGLDTVIGDRGVLLSGGQRQRIAIARAILKDAPILILDEATSALDTASERKIQTALDKLMKQRTTFVIAHRLSTIKHADLILVIEEGRIVEMGNHVDLISKGGDYKTLCEVQYNGF